MAGLGVEAVVFTVEGRTYAAAAVIVDACNGTIVAAIVCCRLNKFKMMEISG